MAYGVLGFLESCGSTDGAEASAEDQVSVASPQPGATRTTRAYKAKDYSSAKTTGPLLTGRDGEFLQGDLRRRNGELT